MEVLRGSTTAWEYGAEDCPAIQKELFEGRNAIFPGAFGGIFKRRARAGWAEAGTKRTATPHDSLGRTRINGGRTICSNAIRRRHGA
jgi:hypothetical protein